MNISIRTPITRKQNGKYYEIETKYGKKIANETTIYIVELIEKGATIETLVLKLMEKMEITYVEAQDYVYNILSEFHLLEMIDFDTHYFDKLLALKGDWNIIGELEFSSLSSFILSNECLYNAVLAAPRSYYSPYALRSRSFYNLENYFYDCKIDGKFQSVIGISNYKELNQPLVINYLCASQLNELASLYINLEKKFLMDKKFKVKIIIPENKKTSRLLEFLSLVEFEHEAVLKKENGENDYYIYSKLL